MDYTKIRKLSLKVFIGFLGLTALIAIVSVLSGDFDSLQLKILGTCFTISAASICSMSCAAFIEKKKRAELGLAGIGLSIIAAGFVIAGMWPEIDNDEYWKTTITFIVFAIALAHAFLLALPELDAGKKWVQNASAISIAVLALLIIVAVWAEVDEEGYYKILTVVAIVVGLETLVVPILMKLRESNDKNKKVLVLESLGDERYKDAAGKIYSVKEIEPEPDALTDEPAADSPSNPLP